MQKITTEELKQVIQSQHGGTATLIQSVWVDVRSDGKSIWQGVVHVFALEGHPDAQRAYAWSDPREDGETQPYVVLHVGEVTGPLEAVRATIVAKPEAADPPDRRLDDDLRKAINEYRTIAARFQNEADRCKDQATRERYLALVEALTELGDALQGRTSK